MSPLGRALAHLRNGALPLPPRVALACAVVAGALIPLASPTIDIGPLAFLSPALLLWSIAAASPRKAFGRGWAAGVTANLLGLYWIAGLLRDFAHLPVVVCVLLYVLLAATQAVGWGLCAVATAVLERRGVSRVVALPLAIVVQQWATPSLFPWTIALSQHQFLPLLQIAEWVGVHGIVLVIALSGTLLGDAVLARDIRKALAALLVVAIPAGAGALRLSAVETRRAAAPTVRVGVAQPNVSIDEKHDRRKFRESLRELQELTRRLASGGAELVIWPESAYPYRLDVTARRDEGRLPRIRRGFRVPVIFGAIANSQHGQRYNSTWLLDESGNLSAPVHKNVLLAFGEYVPFYEELPWLKRTFRRAQGFTAGSSPGVLAWREVRAGVFNCYEDILPSFGRALAAKNPNLLVNVTNDAWFGDTAEPHLHQALAVFRAVELRRDLVRSVNTGVSSFIESTGRVAKRSHTFERTALLGEVRLQEGETLYARTGDVLPWACLVGLALLALPFKTMG